MNPKIWFEYIYVGIVMYGVLEYAGTCWKILMLNVWSPVYIVTEELTMDMPKVYINYSLYKSCELFVC